MMSPCSNQIAMRSPNDVVKKTTLFSVAGLIITFSDITTVIVRVFAAPFSPNFMSKSRGASYMCISSFKPFYPHKISRQNQQDTA